MNVSTLNIKAFRNIDNLTIAFEPDVTVIIGKNNSGKTNLLDALYSSLRVNRTIRQGAFELHDYYLGDSSAMAGDAGPIELVVRFAETEADEWHSDIIAALNEVLALDTTRGTNSLTLRVSSSPPGSGKEEQYEWAFLNAESEPLPTRRNIASLNRLQTLRPFFQLNALRDASREFNSRSTYFSPFITDPTFEDPLRDELSQALGQINDKVVAAHDAFNILRDSIAGGNAILSGPGSRVTIEAVPTRLSELLANTQVSLNESESAVLPLGRHGSGSQSMAVVSLFKAYVTAKLQARLDPLSRAILTIEEPEGHLHPSAARSLWDLVSSINAQIVVTTHSGDLAGEVPMRCIRRLKQTNQGARLYQLRPELFDERDLRHIDYAVRATRGELLFADAWILVEGRCEAMALPELARGLKIDLQAKGLRIVEYQQAGGPAPFIRLADQLGIGWMCLCDGDENGATNARIATDCLAGRDALNHIVVLDAPNLEKFFCKHGFVDVYDLHVAAQKRATIIAAVGSEDHAFQTAAAIPDRRKEEAALAVCAAVKAAPERIPDLLSSLFAQAQRLAES